MGRSIEEECLDTPGVIFCIVWTGDRCNVYKAGSVCSWQSCRSKQEPEKAICPMNSWWKALLFQEGRLQISEDSLTKMLESKKRVTLPVHLPRIEVSPEEKEEKEAAGERQGESD